MARKILKGFGEIFKRPDLGGIMGLIISGLVAFFSLNKIQNLPLFILELIGIAVLVVIVFQIIGFIFVEIGQHISYIKVEGYSNQHQNIDIKIINEFDQDFTDFLVELKRLTLVGYRIDCLVENKRPYFSSGIRIENNRIRAKDSAMIHIAQIPSGNENNFITNFLIDGDWKGNYTYKDISNDTEERKKSLGRLDGAIYEFVIEIRGKIDDDYIPAQAYLGCIEYMAVVNTDKNTVQPTLEWVFLKNYSMRNESKREHLRPDSEVIKNKDDFWRLLSKRSRIK